MKWWRVAGGAWLGALVACSAAGSGADKHEPGEPDDPFTDIADDPAEQPLEPTQVNEDSGAFGASSRPSHGERDAGPDPDAGGEKIPCPGPPALGDLAVVELMISSHAGSGDRGEWLEIESTRDCWLTVGGVTITSPRGAAAPNVATVPDGVELGPHRTFLVAASASAADNHGLTGPLVAWDAADVLKNAGDTITVKLGDTVIDEITYPAFSNLEPGRSLAFPSDCSWAVRADWQRWSLTFDAWADGMKGTPNATNADVACY